MGTSHTVDPPKGAEYLLCLFLPRETRSYLIGDLAEEYSTISEDYGLQKAKFWYYTQVLTSLWPLIQAGLKRIATCSFIVGVIRRLTS